MSKHVAPIWRHVLRRRRTRGPAQGSCTDQGGLGGRDLRIIVGKRGEDCYLVNYWQWFVYWRRFVHWGYAIYLGTPVLSLDRSPHLMKLIYHLVEVSVVGFPNSTPRPLSDSLSFIKHPNSFFKFTFTISLSVPHFRWNIQAPSFLSLLFTPPGSASASLSGLSEILKVLPLALYSLSSRPTSSQRPTNP
jgi:hypothetical protein